MKTIFVTVICLAFACTLAGAQTTQPLAIRADTIHTMSSAGTIKNGVILLRDGKIETVGSANDVRIPEGTRTISVKVVTPGLIDAHTVVGLQGYLNEPREQDQLEKSAPIQPELRAMDAFKRARKTRRVGARLWHHHDPHRPRAGELVPGQTIIIKTRGPTVDDGLIKATAMLSITLGEGALAEEKGKSPGTRPKELALLRSELIKAQEYDKKRARAATRPATESGRGQDTNA
jgi:imidazolonepropionase-like amidohydrolase